MKAVRLTATVWDTTRTRCRILADKRGETLGEYLTKIIDIKWAEDKERIQRQEHIKNLP